MVDGHNGMGHVISKRAMNMALKRQIWYGMVAVRNSTHYGIAVIKDNGYRTGMIGITGTMQDLLLPTLVLRICLEQTLTFGIPTDEEFPSFDCATSISARKD